MGYVLPQKDNLLWALVAVMEIKLAKPCDIPGDSFVLSLFSFGFCSETASLFGWTGAVQ